MDWNRAVERNSDALDRIVAALFAMLWSAGGRPLSVGCADTVPGRATGLARPSDPQRGEVEPAAAPLTSPRERGEVVREADRRGEFILPRRLYAAILAVLRPAESAVRRLILMAAKGLVLMPRSPRPLPDGFGSFGETGGANTPAFTLFDPLKHFPLDAYDNNALPHFAFHHGEDALFQASDLPPEELIDATQLFSRLRAIRAALADIPRQARRLVRWQLRRDILLKDRRRTRLSAMRPGLPPGWRQRSIDAVDDVLKECHRLALYAENSPDTG